MFQVFSLCCFILISTGGLLVLGQETTTRASIIPTEPSLTLNSSGIVDEVMNIVRIDIRNQSLDVIHTPNNNFSVGNNSVRLENGTIVGLGNVYRVGDVTTTVKLQETTLRSAFAVYDVSVDQDIALNYKNRSYPNGHIHMDVDNVTVYTVFKLEHSSATLTLDEFELSVGNVNFNVTGLGDQAGNDSALITEIVAETKEPVLEAFNVAFKALVNTALQAIRSALTG